MGREVKYRAWDTELKHMIVDSPISMAGIMSNHIRKAYDPNGKIIGEQYVVMQCTGLTDKHDKEAYRDDIISYPGSDYIGVIRFGEYRDNDMRTGGHIGFYVDWLIDGLLLRKDLGYWLNVSEVIGNIHQNSELLEAK